MTLPPFAAWKGTKTPRIAIVGEAWGREEEAAGGVPFVGPAGQELSRQLRDAGVPEDLLGFTNVFALRPETNAVGNLCCQKKELPDDYPTTLPPLSRGSAKWFPRGTWLQPAYLPEIDRLRTELAVADPPLVLGVGATACWALLGSGAISGLRGTCTLGADPGAAPGRKCLVTYHPSAIIRGSWSWRPIVLADLMKAWRESASPDLIRPRREAGVNPTLQEVEFWATYWSPLDLGPLACDIETAKGLITCISFAHSSALALTIPFRNKASTANYWPDLDSELRAWSAVRSLLESGRPLVFQNGMYDAQYLIRMGFDLRHMREDTMLLHHSLYPELQKSLGFLGSIYTNEASWKLMRTQRSTKVKGEKLDE